MESAYNPSLEHRHDPANPWSVVEIVLTLMENWKLLVAAPIVGAVLGFAAMLVIPNEYTSVSYIGPLEESVSRSASSFIRSPRVLDAVLEKFPTYPDRNWSLAERRKYLNEHMQWSAARDQDPKRPSLFTLAIENHDPAVAQSLTSSVVNSWLEAMQPPADQKARTEHLLEAAQIQYGDISEAIKTLQKRPELMTSDIKEGYVAPNVVELIKSRADTVSKIEDLKALLAGSSRDWVFEPATTAVRTGFSKLTVVASVAAVAFVLMMIGIVLREHFKVITSNPAYALRFRKLGLSAKDR